MQGDGAAQEIAEDVRTLGSRPDVDVLIVGRGGGSMEDLWAFNEEPVARAIVDCPVPVVSAVGHEVDVTISDLVADHRAPTPSAAAEAVVPDADTLREQLGRVRTRLRRALQGAVDVRRRRLADGPRRLARALQSRTRPLEEQVGGSRRRLDRAMRSLLAARSRRAAVRDRLLRALEVRIGAERSRLHGLAGRLQALSPLATLERGYAIPLSEDGHLLRGTADFTPDADFRLRVRDGQVEARVLGTTPEDATGLDPTTTEDDA